MSDETALLAQLPSLALVLTNHSGAEYSYYDATATAATAHATATAAAAAAAEGPGPEGQPQPQPSGGGAQYAVEVIWPATARQVQRKTKAEVVLVEEATPIKLQFFNISHPMAPAPTKNNDKS